MGLALGVLMLSACSPTAVSTKTPASPTAALPTTSPTLDLPTPSPGPTLEAPTSSATSTAVDPTPVPTIIRPEATISVPHIWSLAFDGTSLWVFTGSGQIARLDPGTNAMGPLATIDATLQEGVFAANKSGLWLDDFDLSLLYRVDPETLKVVAEIPVGPNPDGLAVDLDNRAVWVANHRGGTVDRIDPATNQIAATIPVGNAGPSGPSKIGLGLGSVWVGVPNTHSVYRIDPLTNAIEAKIAMAPGASPCGAFAFTDQAVWTASCQDTKILTRIDPVTNTVVATIRLAAYGDDPIIIDGIPWLGVERTPGQPGRLVRIDPTTNTIDRELSLGDAFNGANLVAANGSIWATDWAGNQILRLPLSAFNS